MGRGQPSQRAQHRRAASVAVQVFASQPRWRPAQPLPHALHLRRRWKRGVRGMGLRGQDAHQP
eukprot:1868573-Prymnesium_polylepis.1